MTAIQSYRNGNAASDQAGPACVCCELQLSSGDDFCPDCLTPSELSRSVAQRENAAEFVSILGASNAGKTVYLGMLLDVLGSRTSPIRGVANGTFSIAFQEQVITALEQRRFPEKTATETDTWKWLHCELSTTIGKKEKVLDFVAPDFAGEAIASELEQAGLYPAIEHVVSRSSGILLLCDSVKVRDSGPREDLFAMKLASYISQINEIDSENQKGPSVAVVFTKADACPEAEEDPTLFAKNNMPRFLDFCERNLPCHSFFAASIVGSSCIVAGDQSGPRQVPLHIEPRGIVEPLQWIVNQ